MSAKLPVLVVDDNPVILASMRQLVERAGGEAVLTDNPENALKLAEGSLFSAVISDYQMPGILGPDLLKRIATIQPDASRIIITGMPSLEAVLRAVNEGEIYRFITKPWVREEMTATIRSAIDRFELLRTNKELSAQSVDLDRRLLEANARLDTTARELEEQRNLLAESRAALESSHHRTQELCLRFLSTVNPLLADQSKMVASLCEAISARGQFTDGERHALHVASKLYDLGLAGIPPYLVATIQEAGGVLDEEAEKGLRNHPIYGQILVSYVDPSRLAGDTIRAHHERFDGTGYPDGLKGQNIPWTARALAVVIDYVVTVGSGQTHENALEQIQKKSGTEFDPQAARLFMSCVQNNPFSGNFSEGRLSFSAERDLR